MEERTIVLLTVDLDVTEEDELRKIVESAKAVDGYLHIEIRRKS